MMAPLEQKVAPSKTPDNQRQNEQPFGHRAGHHLAFTKSAQEPAGLGHVCPGEGCQRPPRQYENLEIPLER
jgi:hypothetical protein